MHRVPVSVLTKQKPKELVKMTKKHPICCTCWLEKRLTGLSVFNPALIQEA